MLNAAIVGLGWWGRNIMTLVERSTKIRVTRVVDPMSEAQQWAAARGIAASADIDDALADPAIGAVILCTPHSLHTAQIARAAAARKHVFCEKPLALRYDEARASIAACRAHGLVLGIGHERRFEPPLLELSRLARTGALGTLLQIEASFCQDKFVTLPPANWRLDAREAPAGPLTATGIHMLDLAVSLLGPAASATAHVERLGSAIANGDTLGALVHFRSGANLLLSAVLATPFAGRLMLYGNRGWAEVRDKAHPEAPEGWILTTCSTGNAPASVEYPPAHAVLANLEAFASAALGEAAYPIAPEEMLATVAALEAIVTSAQSGRLEPVAA